MIQKRERLVGFNFIRAVCAIGIVIYHYSCHTNSNFRPVYYYHNGGNWGSTFVTTFFIISGAVLYLNYNEELRGKALKEFYFKRWKALFPMFYIGYAFFYMEKVFETRAVFWLGSRRQLIQTLFGLDGYLHYAYPYNYYLIGEWFLGAIVLLYLIYPFLLYFVKKNIWIVTGILIVLFGIILKTDFFVIDDFTNLISCMLSFEVGMLIIHYRKYLLHKKQVGVISLIALIIIVCVDINLQWNIAVHIAGICLFLGLYYMGHFLEHIAVCNKLIRELGGNLSFPIFLVQHIVIVKVQGVRNPVSPGSVIVMILITIVLSVIYAKVLSVVGKAVINSKPFLWLESLVMGTASVKKR